MIGWVFLGLRRGRGSIERLGRLWGCGLGESVKTMIGVGWVGVGMMNKNRKCAREVTLLFWLRVEGKVYARMGMSDCLILCGQGLWRGLQLRCLSGRLDVQGGTSALSYWVSLNEFAVERLSTQKRVCKAETWA